MGSKNHSSKDVLSMHLLDQMPTKKKLSNKEIKEYKNSNPWENVVETKSFDELEKLIELGVYTQT